MSKSKHPDQDSVFTYQDKKKEVIDKFSKEFIERNYQTDPLLHSAIEMLVRGADPYAIIESLIEDRKRIIARFTANEINRI